jgi:hypothetical protein
MVGRYSWYAVTETSDDGRPRVSVTGSDRIWSNKDAAAEELLASLSPLTRDSVLWLRLETYVRAGWEQPILLALMIVAKGKHDYQAGD